MVIYILCMQTFPGTKDCRQQVKFDISSICKQRCCSNFVNVEKIETHVLSKTFFLRMHSSIPLCKKIQGQKINSYFLKFIIVTSLCQFQDRKRRLLTVDILPTSQHQAEIYIWSTPNNSNETYTFICLSRAVLKMLSNLNSLRHIQFNVHM